MLYLYSGLYSRASNGLFPFYKPVFNLNHKECSSVWKIKWSVSD